jgi:hypothetical protein
MKTEWRDMYYYMHCYLSIKIKDNVSEWRDMYYYMHCYLSIKIKDNVSEWRDMYYYMYSPSEQFYIGQHGENKLLFDEMMMCFFFARTTC